MTHTPNRREFLKTAAALAAAGWAAPSLLAADRDQPLYKVSVTEYSLHRMMAKGELDHLDYPKFVKEKFDLDAVEYWSSPFGGKVKDEKYIAELRQRADDAGIKGLVILVDGEGHLGDPDEKKRRQAVENHFKWVDAGKTLGCHSIRVNARSEGSPDEQRDRAADGLRQLSEFAAKQDINVIVENHGGLSSNGRWLASVMKQVNLPNCGTLPDFGNFHGYDRYKGVKETMPYAKGVSAKTHEFDAQGNEVHTDYLKMMKIVLDAGYHGYVGIEWEGSKPGEVEGIKLTKALLERVREQLAG